MAATVIALLPYIIGSAVVPLQIIVGLLLLKNPNQGLLKAALYVVGMTITRVFQGLIFGLVLSQSDAFAGAGDSQKPVLSLLLLGLGIALLIAAYKKWQNQPDIDDMPPKGLSRIDSLTPVKALAIGLSLPLVGVKLWFFTLSALATISAAQLGQPDSSVAFLIFILLAESLLILPIAVRIIVPKRSQSLLSNLSDWLNQKSRPITITVSLVFGLFFVHSGLMGLR
jgi:Sap, sulfolipid-1-addressing protein